MCKKFKFDHTYKWYTHNPASVVENDTPKLLWDFDIQTDHQISARRPDLIINKKTNKKNPQRIYKISNFAVPADHRIKLKEYAKKNKYFDLARELKKLWNMKVTIISVVIGVFGTVTKGISKGLGILKGLGSWQRRKRPSKLHYYWERPGLHYYWERPEYWEESWKLEETFTPVVKILMSK